MRHIGTTGIAFLLVGCSTMSDLSGLTGGDRPCEDCTVPPEPVPSTPPTADTAPTPAPPAPSLRIEAVAPIVRGASSTLRITVGGDAVGPFHVRVTGAPLGVHVDDVELAAIGTIEVPMTAAVDATEGDAQIVAEVSSRDGTKRWSTAKMLVRGPSGSLDRTFGKGGIVTTSFGEMGVGIRSLVVLPDGKIIAVGSGDADYQIARYTTDGKLDTTFSGDGKATVAWPTSHPGWTYSTTVASTVDGHIMIAGIVDLGNVGIVRFDASGALDTTYANAGRLLAPKSGVNDGISAATLDDQERVVIAGYTMTNSYDSMVARFTPSGSPDMTFAGTGRMVQALSSSNDFAVAVGVQPDGKLLVAGQASAQPYEQATIARTKWNGEPDTTFGTQGILRFDAGESIGGPSGLAMNESGIYLSGGFRSTYETWVARVSMANGTLDYCKKLPRVGEAEASLASALQADGKLVIVGWTSNASIYDFLVRRVLPDGSIDSSFGGSGVVAQDFGGGVSDGAAAVALQSDGRILVGGYTDVDNLRGFALARYWP